MNNNSIERDGTYYPIIEFGARRYVSSRPFSNHNDASMWAYNRIEAIFSLAETILGGWKRER